MKLAARIRLDDIIVVTILLATTIPLVFAQPNTISQIVNIQLINYLTGLPLAAQVTVTYTCMNPNGSWYPYAIDGFVGLRGATFTLVCTSPATFNPWIHAYAQSGFWYGTSDYNGIPRQGGIPVNLGIGLSYSYGSY